MLDQSPRLEHNKSMQNNIRGKTLVFESGEEVHFEYPIRSAIDVGEITVVVLDIPRDVIMTENVFGVTSKGIKWQIQRIPETSKYPVNCYMDTRFLSEEVVRVGNWNGFEVDVCVRDGQVIGKNWLK
jgi:hypothetical protein